MSIFSRKTSINVFLLSINFILLAIISRVVIADESTNAILEQSTYLYYYESDDALLEVGQSQLYTFAPIPGEDITIVAYGLDDSALTSISLFDNNSNLVGTGTTNQVTEKPDNTDTNPQSPFITAIEHTANSSGLYYFEVKNESGDAGLIRTMLFVGEPFNTDLTLIDELNPLLPSKAFMVAGDPDREWINELTGEQIQGLRTEVDVLPIERIDRAPDVFLSYSTLSYLPDVTERLEPVTFDRWFNQDDQEIYLVNIRPVPEKEADGNRAILENLNYQTYNSNNFFFFEYLFSVGNGSDPIALDRGAGACAGLSDRIDCISSDPNLGREVTSSSEETLTIAAAPVEGTTAVEISGEVVSVTIDRTTTCTAFNGATGNPVTVRVTGSATPTTVCVPTAYIPATGTFTTGTFVAGNPNTCTGTANDDAIACTSGNDIINALAGNDAIIADAGNDIIDGGAGNDFILAGSGNDTVNGGSGYDSIDGGSGNDTINLGIDGGLAVGGIGTDTFIIDDDHTTGYFSIIAGGANLSTVGDGEQDIYDFNGNPTGSIGIYTESVDLLDFEDYGSSTSTGVTINPTNITDTNLTILFAGALPSNISGSEFVDTFNLSSLTANLNIDANGGADVINTGSGDDTIDGGAGADTINSGAGNDTINVNDGDGADTIDGGLGTDLINAISSSNPLIVTLNNAVGSIYDTVTLESDAVSNIENVTTGSGADQFFISDIDNNIINAGDGDDVATISGGIGTINVTRSGDNVAVSAIGIGVDQYNSVIQVNVSGNDFTNDNFIVNDANDNIFNGLGGTDSIDYATTSEDILVDFYATNTAEVSGTSIGTDTLINFEQIATDSGNDEFIFNSAVGTVTINSRAGNDIFNFDDASGTLNLIDTSGSTFLDFIDYTDGVVIDLASVAQQTVSLSDSSLLVTLNGTFNNVSGSAFADNISGTTSSDTIYGGAGADQIYGEDNNDFLYGEDGNDRIEGGAGDDTIDGGAGNDDIDGGTGTDFIDESSNATGLVVTLSNITGVGNIVDAGASETDTVDNVENIDTGSGLDTFFIDDIDNNIINAGGGDDVATISGGSGTITVTRSGDDVDVSDSGGGIGTDEYNSVFQVNINASAGNDIVNVTDENDNIITGNGGVDTVNTVKNTVVSGTITITRSGVDVDVSGAGIGTDTYNAINTVNVTGSTEDETFYLTDENDNTITGGGGTDIVNVSSTATSADNEMITVIRTGSNVAVTGGFGIGTDNYNDIDQVNVTAGDGDDTFNIFDTLDNIFDGGAGNDTANYAPTTFDMTIILDGSSSYTITGTGVGTDILLNIENINTGSGNDTIIIQDDNDNTINGGAGNDVGTSVMDGVYSGVITIIRSPSNVVTVSGSGFGTDVYTDIETVNVTSVGGDDIFRPSDSNNNTFDAAGGTDWIDYSTITGTVSVVVDLSTGTATGDGSDTLIGFENISGSIGSDTLTGDGNANIIDGYTGNDIINAGGGDDTIIGGDGDDDIDGGAGTDYIDESSNTTGLIVTLSNIAGVGSIVDAGAGETDTVDNVENIDTGSGLDTFFIDDLDDNIINAGAGNDVATVSGGSGTITITRTVGDVTVTDTGGGIGTDQYNSVFQVNVNGSATNDIFVVTDANDNILDGGAGTDSIDYATTSDDILVEFTSASTANVSGASIGNDTLIDFEEISTDSGDDYFLFDANVGTVTINSRDGNDIFDFDNASGALILSDISGSTFLDFTDYTDGVVIDLASNSQQTVSLSDLSLFVTLSSGTFNNVSGSAFVDNIRGTTSVDTIYGGGSADTIYGEDNDDFLYGGDGADTIDGGDGVDTIDGGDGADTIYGGLGNDIILGGLGNDYIDGGDGTEYIDASATGNDMVVVLSNIAGVGYIQDTGTGEIDTVDNIENVDTGGGNDVFTISDSDDNTIDAGSETTADVVTVTGGTGTINITRDATGVTVSDGTTGTGIGNDRYNDVELVNVSGSATDDTFVVDDANDNILDGQGGNDSVSYAGVGTAINVTIISNQATISGAGTGVDTLYNIENIETGSGADFFDITGTVNYGLNANSGADIFDFNTNVDGSLAIETSDGAHLDFQDYDTAISLDLGLTGVSQTVDGGLVINLTGTFDSISGTDFADNISGTANVDTIYGGADNDRIWGEGDDDFLFGGDGADTIDGGDGVDTIDGGDGADTIYGGLGNDIIFGGDGADTIDGGDGVDTIDGGDGADTIDGGDGNDIILGGLGNDYIDGGDGTEYIDASATGNDMVVVLSNIAGVGYIQDTGTGEIDTVDNIENVDTGGGNDVFTISDSDDNTIDAGSETTADVVTVTGGTGTINITRDATGVTVSDGTTGTGIGNDRYNDVELVNVSGSATDDTFVVDDANDNILDGQGGNDSVSYAGVGTAINVTIISNQATISGAGTGVDTLYNIENIETGSGADFFDITGTVNYGLNANTGADIFDFNTNVDGSLAIETSDGAHLDFQDYDTAISLDLGLTGVSQTVDGDLVINLTGTFDSISGTDFADNISGTANVDTIYGGADNDRIWGEGDDDFLFGGDGADTIDGGDGVDTIDGGDGADTIYGGLGNDIILGGLGNDYIDGGDGTEYIDASATGNDMVVVLSNIAGVGYIQDTGTGEIDTVDNIENVDTGGGNDVFTISDSDDNTIDAGSETTADVVTVTGGTGTINITRDATGVTVSDGTTGTGIGNDRYNDVELVNVSGSATDDTFVVDDANDNILDGGDGDDTISYSPLATPITVTIVGNQASISATTGIGVDTLYNIENIETGSGADFFDITGTVDYGLNSNSGADIFFFNGNVDGTLEIGTTGVGTHLDFGSFTSAGINIDLSSAVSQSVTGSLEISLTGTFTSISGTTFVDNISGTTNSDTIWAGTGADTIFGDAGADFLYGEAGADTIDGGAGVDTIDGGADGDIINGGTGNDIIRGGAGDDDIDGGADTDTFDESDSISDFTIIMDSSSGTSSSAVEGNDTLVGIENINTGSGNDNFTLSDSGINIIDAATGTDTVTILNANNITIVRNGAGDVVTVTDNATGVGNDVYNNVEFVNVSGTSGDDVFTIDDQFDNIINGLGGTNEINYSLVTAIINVNALSTGTTISSTGLGSDTLINIQNITTGDGADTFIIEENSIDNKYDADDGIDTATYTAAGTITASVSGSGISVQVSGSDTDQLDNFETIDFVGSTGDDTFIIQDTNDNTIDGSSESSQDTYDASFATNDITVNITGTVTADGSEIGTDTLINIEEIKTGSGNDTFIIDTSFDGVFFFDAGEATVGNIFQFTGNGTGNMNITITSSSTSTDVLDFSQFTGSGLNIDLNANTATAGSLFVTFDNFIDDVIGSDQDDTITGNSLQNEISGGGGNDTINYSAGNDIIDGGTGDDTVNYIGAPDAITATLSSSGMSVSISGTSDTQTITNVENISGTANDDTFIINEAVSTTINAQGGTDTVDYSGLTDAINVDLSTGIGHVSGTSTSEDHTLQDVEDVIGSNFDDTIIGNSDDNTIQGGGGDDFIQGNEGNDVIDGGTGTNTVSYKDASSGVNVNLKSGSSSGGDGNDTLTNIDNVSGSGFGDNISGTAGTNVIYGGGGADTIYGNEGDDEIYGEAGDDILYGGSSDAVSGTSDDGNDTIYGGDGDDTIYGGNNNSGGGNGNDNSGGGSDVIEGGDGDDTIYGGNNNSGGGTGNDGDDILSDTDDTADDTDVIYGDNNNTGGGTGGAGSDTITTLDGDNDDTIAGDNKVDAATANDPAVDVIIPDVAPPDSVDPGDDT